MNNSIDVKNNESRESIKLNSNKYPKIFLKKNSSKRIKSGHLWVFSNELQNIPKLDPGSVVEVEDGFGLSYGLGFYNPNSLISVRLLKTNEKIDKYFFNSRITKAINSRTEILKNNSNYRLVYGESDFLPGLIIDKFENSFVIQIQSAGMEKFKNDIKDSLLEIFQQTDFILLKANSKLREIEGLSMNDEVLFGVEPEFISTTENDIKLEIQLSTGQKTGYFLDQRLNRYKVREISTGKTVLDCFTNQGGFALNAMYAGAKSVSAVDSSASVIQIAKKNAELNNLDIEFEVNDVFNYLENAISIGSKWDVVILDPPAFTKNKKTIATALAAYSKLNKLGLKVLNNNGYLVSSSCSHHISELDLIECINKEAAKQNIYLKLLHRGTQGIDHPVLLSMPETNYLKFLIFKVEQIL